MPDRIRFHLDEHIDPDVAKGLLRRAIDVTTTNEKGLRTASDPTQFAFAVREQRVFVTGDRGVITLASEIDGHPGVAFVHRARISIGEQVNALIFIHEVLTPAEMRDRIEYVR